MIQARKGGLRGVFWAWYAEGALRRAFGGVWWRGPRPKPADGPMILYANHRSYWDAFASHALTRGLELDGFGMMAEENLAKFPFLRHLGAFSIRQHDARSAVETFRYVQGLLKRPASAVVMFPEGELRANARPPLKLQPGVASLAKLTSARCVPVGLRCVFFEGEKPELLIELGEAHGPGPVELFQRELDAAVNRVDQAQTTKEFTPLILGSRSIAERWRTWRG